MEMESQDSHLAKVEPQEQSKSQTPILEDDPILGFCSLGGSQPYLEESSPTQEKVQKLWSASAKAQENEQEPYEESSMGSQDATQRAYWAELQNTLPLPLTNLLEQEALEILTKSLHSYNKGIGKDHKLTQQLQRRVEQLNKNLNSRQPT